MPMRTALVKFSKLQNKKKNITKRNESVGKKKVAMVMREIKKG